ncbi:hypothetical protein NHQ30_002071 [Ciborinia camelliae]|nr:hypothetical protein NHQ30_002071 [Ciborinia camelliae]
MAPLQAPPQSSVPSLHIPPPHIPPYIPPIPPEQQFHIISQDLLFDPTKVSPETAATFPSSVYSTLSFALSPALYSENIESMGGLSSGYPSAGYLIPDCDIPLPSVEPPDFDMKSQSPLAVGWMG